MKIVFGCFITIGFLFSADISIAGSDFIERFINFVIFFSILWYLGADKVKGIFSQRTQNIARQFNEMQEQEKSLKRQREDAESLLADNKIRSDEIIARAKKEAFLITQEFDARLEQDVRLIASSFHDYLKQEKKNIINDEVSRAIEQASGGLHNDRGIYLQILTKALR